MNARVTSIPRILLWFSVLLLPVAMWVAFVSSLGGIHDGILGFAIRHHNLIMAGMVILAVLFGFALAHVLGREIKSVEHDKRRILETVFRFLNPDERAIVDLLFQHQGMTTQAEISRLGDMGRVRAHRALQRMQAKGVVVVEPHGKARHVRLVPEILETLR